MTDPTPSAHEHVKGKRSEVGGVKHYLCASAPTCGSWLPPDAGGLWVAAPRPTRRPAEKKPKTITLTTNAAINIASFYLDADEVLRVAIMEILSSSEGVQSLALELCRTIANEESESESK